MKCNIKTKDGKLVGRLEAGSARENFVTKHCNIIYQGVGTETYIDVKEVTVYNPVMIDAILTAKFNKTFKKIIAMAKLIIDDEDSTDDHVAICLDEVELVRQILLNKYNDFLNYEKEQLFLQKLRIIENELRIKAMYIKEKAMFLEMEEEKTRSRGR